MSTQSDPDPVPVVPPTIEENPSATGVVDGEEEDVEASAAAKDAEEG